mmetsp:Transcript_2548/g.3398  ORF Transcript_2548/g.3398 Transcript_2548/m.3398 type:complete len:216 (+) Transcript_2548:69-716(+)
MAYHGPSYGLSAEVAAKQAAKYDVALENSLRKWIEAIVGRGIGADFHEGLKDGVLLCDLINKIKPRSVPKVNKMKMPFMMMENIQNFLAGCRGVGVKDTDIFAVVDLYEKKNPTLVIQGLAALARAAPSAGFTSPAFVPPEGKAGGDVFSVNYEDAQSFEEKSYSQPAQAAAPATKAAAPAAAASSSSVPKFCPECGTKTIEGSRFCGECGHKFL